MKKQVKLLTLLIDFAAVFGFFSKMGLLFNGQRNKNHTFPLFFCFIQNIVKSISLLKNTANWFVSRKSLERNIRNLFHILREHGYQEKTMKKVLYHMVTFLAIEKLLPNDLFLKEKS